MAMGSYLYGGLFMKKRLRLLITTALLAVSVLSGCGNSQNDEAANTKTISSIDDLEGAKIAVQLGTVGDIYASDYEGDEAGTTVERYNKTADAVQALKQDKVNCVIVDEQPAIAFTKDDDSLEILDEAFAIEEYAICIAKGNDELLGQVNEALAELEADGTLDMIKDNYIGDDTKGTCPYVTPEGTTYDNGTLVVATNATFPPYEYYNEGTIVGIDIEIITAIGDKLGMKTEINDMEFDSIINAVNTGKADVGIAGMTMTEERLKSINFSDPYTTSTQVIIVNNGTESQSSIGLVDNIKRNFITDSRWKYIANGLVNTLIIAVCAIIIGLILGFIVAIIRSTYETTGKLGILDCICRLYLTIFRGTPMMIQLLIIYYVVFNSISINKILVAIIAFGINSGAYMAETIRAGIMSVDGGQMEAGRSLGLNYVTTIFYIIIPQAVKNTLPALVNEFIALIKETSICGYIGLTDLTRGGDIIRSITYDAFMPLIAVAIIYLVIVQILTKLTGKMERGLRKHEE